MLFVIGYILGMLSLIDAKSFYVPDNVNFITRFYDNSSMYAVRNQTVRTMCYDIIERDGRPRCCYKLLRGINVFNSNISFDEKIGNVNGEMISYDCRLSKFKDVNTGEIFTWIGIIFTAIMAFSFVICIMLKCYMCFCKRDKYYRIN